MNNLNSPEFSPLTLDDIQLIDSSQLSMLDRHHLRILAHCLACFKLMNKENLSGILPSETERLEWLLKQPALKKDKDFIALLLKQFVSAALHLEHIARQREIAPLELTLSNLIDEYSRV